MQKNTITKPSTMEKKQSSIEWLVRKLSTELIGEIPMHRWDGIREAVQEAKAMHNDEIKNAYITGIMHPLETEATKQAEEYYNETYGNNTDEITSDGA